MFIRTIRAAMALGLLASLAGAAQAQDTVNIGNVLPLSGPSADYVKRHLLLPTTLAVKEINEAGGLLGKQVRIFNEDSRNDPSSAVSALRKLLAVDKVIAVSTAYTPLTLAEIPIAEDNGIILLAPSTEHPDVTKSNWTIRMTTTADKSGTRIAQVAADMGYKTAVTLSEDNEAVRLTDRAFAAEFARRGGKVLVSETFKRDDTDLRGQLTKFKAVDPDVVYITASTGRPLALALRQFRETGFAPKQIFSVNSMDDAEVKALSPDLTDNVIFATLRLDPAFAERFKRETGEDADANVGKHYDAIRFLFESIKRANSLDPAKVRDAMYHFGEYKGVVGDFVFNGSGEPNIQPALMTMKNGQVVPYVK